MTISPVFLCPHSSTSGGIKVIFRVAQGLFNKGIQTYVLINKLTDKSMCWLGSKPTFPIIEAKRFSKYDLPPEITHLIFFGDGTSFGPIPEDVKTVLYLQHFGVHQYERECINMLYPYDAIVTVSQWLAEIATNQFSHEKVYIIPGGVDNNFKPTEIKKSKDFTTIGCLYHEAEFKNVRLFVLAMNKLYQTNPNIQALFMSAKKPTSALLDDLACPYTLVINPPHHLIPMLYSGVDIWVAPSYSEGFGLIPIENMSCGVPTIIVKSHGLDKYLLHNENCVTVNNSKMEVVSAVKMLLQDDATREKIIQGGLELAKRFTWTRAINSFIKVLKEI